METIENRESVVPGNWPPVEDDKFAVGTVQCEIGVARPPDVFIAHHRSTALGAQHIAPSLRLAKPIFGPSSGLFDGGDRTVQLQLKRFSLENTHLRPRLHSERHQDFT